MNIKIMSVIIAGIIIVAAIAVIAFGTTAFDSPYWETETQFGSWHDEIIITFDDGTTESFKIITDGLSKPFTVYYGTKKVTNVDAVLYAEVKETGGDSGYDGAEVTVTDFAYNIYLKKSGVTKWSDEPNGVDRSYTIAMGDTKSFVGFNVYASTFDNKNTYPAGTYTLHFNPVGTAAYKPYPGGTWTDVQLPPDRSITITISYPATGQIVVTLSTDIRVQ